MLLCTIYINLDSEWTFLAVEVSGILCISCYIKEEYLSQSVYLKFQLFFGFWAGSCCRGQSSLPPWHSWSFTCPLGDAKWTTLWDLFLKGDTTKKNFLVLNTIKSAKYFNGMHKDFCNGVCIRRIKLLQVEGLDRRKWWLSLRICFKLRKPGWYTVLRDGE